MILEFAHVGRLPDSGFQLFLQLSHIVFADPDVCARSTLARSILRTLTAGIAKISPHSLLYIGAGAQKPKDDEERHHGGDKIGIRHFPSPSVMATMNDLLNDDDGLDEELIGFISGHS